MRRRQNENQAKQKTNEQNKERMKEKIIKYNRKTYENKEKKIV